MGEFAENIWTFEDEIRVAPGVYFPVRMTVIRLKNGSLVLHSPIRMSEEVVARIQELGPVRYIAAPNLFHHLFVLKAMELFPEAKLFIADGLEKKRTDLKDFGLLSQPPQEWSEDIELILYEGIPLIGEYVFFHKTSRTLVTADVVFNVQRARNGISRLLLRLDGIYQKLSQGRLLDVITKDRSARRTSMQKILEFDFDKVLMAHGPPIKENAKNLMKQACLG